MSNDSRRLRPVLIVISAPSGAGKSTLCDMLLSREPHLVYSVSCTTRRPRGKEKNGEDYFFITDSRFEEHARNGEFLEHAVVHGHRYGTLLKTVLDALESGKSVVMDIDVQGAGQVREKVREARPGNILKDRFVDIFIMPPSFEVLRERLAGRGEDAPEVVEQRLKNAQKEMAGAENYSYIVENNELENAYSELSRIIRKERLE